MFNLSFIYMCLLIGVYLYFYHTDAPFPDQLRTLNFWACWGLLAVGGIQAGRIIADCLMSAAKNEMSAPNVRDGILLALLGYLPTLLISVFLLREGFMERT